MFLQKIKISANEKKMIGVTSAIFLRTKDYLELLMTTNTNE